MSWSNVHSEQSSPPPPSSILISVSLSLYCFLNAFWCHILYPYLSVFCFFFSCAVASKAGENEKGACIVCREGSLIRYPLIVIEASRIWSERIFNLLTSIINPLLTLVQSLPCLARLFSFTCTRNHTWTGLLLQNNGKYVHFFYGLQKWKDVSPFQGRCLNLKTAWVLLLSPNSTS